MKRLMKRLRPYIDAFLLGFFGGAAVVLVVVVLLVGILSFPK